MISIRQNLSELEKSDRTRALAVDCYVSTIDTMAHYAVDLDETITAPHRKYLSDLAAHLANASVDVLVESRSTLRGLLRDYRDRAAHYLSGLRSQLASTEEALQQMVEGLALCDTDQGARMNQDLGRLRVIANTSERGIQTTLRELTESLEHSLEQIRKKHQFTISQLQTEMRLLHNRVDSLESAAATDDVSKLSTRRFMAEYLGALPPEGACVLILKMRGLADARARFGTAIADDVVGTFGRRLRNTVPKETVVGRWSEQDFLAVVPGVKSGDAALAKKVAEHLSMPYACMLAGKVVRVPLVVTADCLAVPKGSTAEQLQERVAAAFL